MTSSTENNPTTLAFVAAGSCLLLAAAGGLHLWKQNVAQNLAANRRGPMLVAPMIGVIEPCILARAGDASIETPNNLVNACAGREGSAAALVESTLTALKPNTRSASPYELGYTLPVPLLQLFRSDAGRWSIDRDVVGRLVRTVRDTDRPLILYLFSTHFAVNSPLEAALAGDPANLAQTRDGPLRQDTYYDFKINNWTFATTHNDITARRVQAIEAVLQEICRLQPRDIAKIRGVTLLGELHHLFPDFQHGMGFNTPYRVTDYSAASVTGFQNYLKEQFKTIAQLNRALNSDFKSFGEVVPPSRDIRSEPLKQYVEHIDSFAHGSLPIAGWLYAGPASATEKAWVQIYRDGEFIGRSRVGLGRRDVIMANPQFGDTNTGWRLDMDFRHLAVGSHRIDVFLEQENDALVHLGTRHIAVMDRQRRAPEPLPQKPLPANKPADASLKFHIDHPAEQSTYFFNPLVPLWHAYRAQQVKDYLQYFDRVVGQTCLSTTPHYTHQITPFANPSWDENKFAIQASLLPMEGLRPGVSLYGEAGYGFSFPQWYARSRHKGYGVTEFHPLKAMDSDTLDRTLAAHAARGAEFLSFFIEPRWQGQLVERGHNQFSFDPSNPQFGSDHLYRSMQQILAPTSAGFKETLQPAPTAPLARPSPTGAALP